MCSKLSSGWNGANSCLFDRTIKVSQTESLEKDQILQRMPHNLRTLEPLMEQNVEDFHRLTDENIPAARN